MADVISSGSRIFDFFGDITRITVNEQDASDLEFFYGDYACEGRDPVYEVALSTASNGFFSSLLAKDQQRKQVSVRDLRTGEHLLDASFTDWSYAPSPLPPLMYTSRRDSVAAFPACTVSLKGQGVAIFGANYSGKTAVALELCDRFADFVSDNCSYFDLVSHEVLNASWPLGFRRTTLDRYSTALEALSTRETISPVTGRVVLVRPRSFLANVASAPVPLRRVLLLNPVDQLVDTPRLTWIPRPAFLPHFSGARAEVVMAALPSSVSVVTFQIGTHSSTVADVLLSNFMEDQC